jgi:oligopeptidase A
MSTAEPNPLLEIPAEAIPFATIRPEHIEPAIERLLVDAKAAIAQIAASAAPRTYQNTLGALEDATEALELAMTLVGHLESVATSPALRGAYNAVQPPVAAFYAGLPLDEGLWRALRAYEGTDDAAQLQGARRRLLHKTLDNFRRHGAELDPAGKQRLREIDVELAERTTTFAQNILDAANLFELVITDEAQLAGLPESARAAAREDASARDLDGWRFSLQEPSLVAALTYLDDPAIRRRVYHAYNTRAAAPPFDNRPHLAKILELRREKAALLGYADFAELVLSDRMAKTGARARAFVDDLRRRVEAAFIAENHDLLAFRRALEGPEAPPLAPWDLAYYAEKQRQARYEFDDEALRPYFSAERALAGLFEVSRRLYGVRVQARTGLPVWHDSVRTYALHDRDDRLIGYFYVDLYPREEKRGGAWMNPLIIGRASEGGPRAPHVGLFCANVSPPAGGKPALLTHGEVETLFHEFGHLLHHLLTEVDVRSLAGTNVAWDFVELPSQIMENWCWEREALDLFARHHESDAPLPDDLLARLLRARNFRSANHTMRQLGFATVDLALHTEYDPARDGDPLVYARRVAAEFAAAPLPADYAMILGFSHLFAGPVAYAAGYYSYKWAEVLDADAFARFRDEGVLSSAVGEAFRRAVLARGDSDDPRALFVDFLGREPDPSALLRRSGLLGAT